MAKPDIVDIIIYRGDGFSKEYQWLNRGEPQVLTGLTGTGQIRETRESEDVLADFVVSAVDADNGIFKITLTSSVTRGLDLSDKQFVYDVQYAGGTVTPETVVMGRVTVIEDVTR